MYIRIEVHNVYVCSLWSTCSYIEIHFNDCQFSDQEVDVEIVSVDSQTDEMNHNEFSDIFDSKLNSKENDDKDDDDD